MTEILCDNVVFHFNKAHLSDPAIPMWSIKAKGKTFYVNHVDCNLPWSTKETPDNNHTKGSIKIRDCVLTIDSENCASIDRPTPEQRRRLSGKRNPVRIMYSGIYKNTLDTITQRHDIKLARTVEMTGDCGTYFLIAEMTNPEDLVILTLAMPPQSIRVLTENEHYYRLLDQTDQDQLADPYEDEDYSE